TLDLTYTDAALNPYSNSVLFQVAVSAGGPVTFLSEDFNAGLPGAWTVVDGGNGTDTWTEADPCARGIFADTYMMVDSDCALLGAIQDEELITPLIDASAASAVTLQFDHYFKGFASDGANDDFGTVRVRSTLTGGAWIDLIQWNENDDTGVETITLDATATCAGAADCQFGWRYEGEYDWYWGVDNVVVDGAGCESATCTSCGEPSATDISPAVPPLMVGTTGAVTVEEIPCATGYVVYENALGAWYGTPGRVCVSPATPNGDGTVTLTGYSVPVDSWIAVASANAVSESSCGRDDAGAERNAQPGWPPPAPCP
ncbi:MAG: choice-of-anchor J domain-containing protein, partial [Acidobacteriota bacterium]